MSKQSGVLGNARLVLAVGVFVATIALAMTLVVSVRSAPAEQALIESSYARARAVLDVGVKALGPAPDDLSLHLQGRL